MSQNALNTIPISLANIDDISSLWLKMALSPIQLQIKAIEKALEILKPLTPVRIAQKRTTQPQADALIKHLSLAIETLKKCPQME